MAKENGKRISKDEMHKMRNRYKETKKHLTESVYFDRATFERLLSHPETVGVRVYYGVNDKDELHPIFVPVAATGKNLLVAKSGESTIEDYGNPCPPLCPTDDE